MVGLNVNASSSEDPEVIHLLHVDVIVRPDITILSRPSILIILIILIVITHIRVRKTRLGSSNAGQNGLFVPALFIKVQ